MFFIKLRLISSDFRAFFRNWLIFIFFYYPKLKENKLSEWKSRNDHSSWTAQKIKSQIISEHNATLALSLPTIKTLIAICPLLGLLGTVTGMVTVFDTIALTGTSDAKVMANGIYKATLPTMSGLFLAITALYFHHNLQQKNQKFCQLFLDKL